MAIDVAIIGIDNQEEGYKRKGKRKLDMVETSVEVPGAEEVKKERKKKLKEKQATEDDKGMLKKAKSHPETRDSPPDGSEIVEGETGLEPETKKKKRKKNKNPSLGELVVSDKEIGTKKRKASNTEATEDPSLVISEDVDRSKKKVKRKEKGADLEASEQPDPDASQVSIGDAKKRRKKKPKHKEVELAPEDPSGPVEPSTSPKRKKRSRKDDEFPDPSEDSALSDSARKALEYVHSRVASHPDWKFNKARQNWVLRNVWDDSAIPETYFLSCVKYLADVQGNTRDLLIKSSTILIHPPPSDPEPKETTTDGVAPETAPPKPETEAPTAAVAEPSEDQERRRKAKVERARTILSALGADAEMAN